MTYKYENAIIIGCDNKQEDILFWFLQTLKKYSPHIPIQLVDFGLNEPTLTAVKSYVSVIYPFKPKENKKAWFNKPSAMLLTKAKKTLWLDIDCEVTKDITDIFDLSQENKIGLVPDLFYCQYPERYPWQYNSGVVLFEDRPKILYAWDAMIEKSQERGDQEVLRDYLLEHRDIKDTAFFDLPSKYNVVRLFYATNASKIEDIRIIHWTGKSGKDIIRTKKINAPIPSGNGTSILNHDYRGDENQYKPKELED